MRSKEVEYAILEGKRLIDFWNNYNYATEEGKADCLYSAKSIETLLSYIEKLEQLPNKIREKIKIIEGYSKMAKEEITERVLVADTNSLNYGRMEAHNADIYHLKEIIGE